MTANTPERHTARRKATAPEHRRALHTAPRPAPHAASTEILQRCGFQWRVRLALEDTSREQETARTGECQGGTAALKKGSTIVQPNIQATPRALEEGSAIVQECLLHFLRRFMPRRMV